MDNEKTKELAQSYVDELFLHDDMTDQENIENKNDAFVMCMAFAGHILETHCIVEKDFLKAKYQKAKEVRKRWHGEYEIGAIDMMELLFGEELFNDKEK